MPLSKHLLNRELKLIEAKINQAKQSDLHREISNKLITMLRTGEDRRHKIHPGFDLYAIARASYSTVIKRKLEGASTIEQQLARTLTGQRTISLTRKIKEIIIANWIYKHNTKDESARIYLQYAYFGSNMTGLAAACTKLNIAPSTADLDDCARLIALLKYPEPGKPSQARSNQIEHRIAYLKHKQVTQNWIK